MATPFGTRSALHESHSTPKSHIFNSVNVATSCMSSDICEPEAQISDYPCPASDNEASPMTKKDKMGTDPQLSEMVGNIGAPTPVLPSLAPRMTECTM